MLPPLQVVSSSACSVASLGRCSLHYLPGRSNLRKNNLAECPLETVITVQLAKPKEVKVHKPLAAVVREDVVEVMQANTTLLINKTSRLAPSTQTPVAGAQHT